MTVPRSSHTATLLPDGKVLLAGGASNGDIIPTSSAELYDPSTGTFTATGNMTTPRSEHTATLPPNGKVLIAGGIIRAVGGLLLPQLLQSGGCCLGDSGGAQIFHPARLVPSSVLFSLSGHAKGQGAILHAGTARIVSPNDPAVAGEALEIYGTGLIDDSVIAPQVAVGAVLPEVLYFGKTPGFAGLNQVNIRMPSGITPGAVIGVRMNYLSRPSKQVTIAVK